MDIILRAKINRKKGITFFFLRSCFQENRIERDHWKSMDDTCFKLDLF